MTIGPTVVPSSTYRLQLQPDFTFADAEAVVPYLASLGVSHLHLSPVLQAVPGSTHGYDVVDHARVSEELGGEDGLRSLARTARAHGLGLVLDIVPNHMAVPAPERLSRPLWSVLRDGPGSPWAKWFDIDWAAQDGKLLMPVLGGPLEDVIDELTVERDEASAEPVLRYYDHVFPLRPGTDAVPRAELLEAQWYRLAHWRQARTGINYRRFFTISDLIAVRVEDPEVFDATHGTVQRLLRDGVADGLRIDHPDGLADPAGYLRRLGAATGGRWTVVEKILTGDERLPDDWECAGTTGYDALDRIDGLFTDPAGLERIAAFYREFTQAPADQGGDWTATARGAAERIAAHDLAAEVERLGSAADAVRAMEAGASDVTGAAGPGPLREAIRALLVRMPVYRPYVVPGERATRRDTVMLMAAAEDARAAAPELADAVDFVRDLALGRTGGGPAGADFAVRFAQVSSALRAKSVEDTAFYRWFPLLSLNEVGRDPARPSVPPELFHDFCAALQRDHPTTGTVLTTHDTKRSADVRAGLAALTEVPGQWREWLLGASAGMRARLERGGVPVPERHTEYLAWQYAVVFNGVDATDRICATLLKSVREAALRTSWTEQDTEYEKRLGVFTRELFSGGLSSSTGDIARAIEAPARANRLGSVLLHLTMPGVPDIYQGDEDRQLLMVDPDNRLPFRLPDPRHRSDEEKLSITTTALRLRREHPEWFGPRAGYEPLYARGPAAGHCVAFVRTGRVVTAVTRLSHGLHKAGGWRDTELPLPPGSWTDLLTGARFSGPVRTAELFAVHPVALLVLG